MAIRINKNQFKKVSTLIKTQCCNCKGDYCIALDDECMQLLSPEHIYCKYFVRAVLPIDENLKIDILKAEGYKLCETCKKMFMPGSNRQRFCKKCSEQNYRAYMQKYMNALRNNVKL